MNELKTKYFIDRIEWINWLETNFETEDDIWLVYPVKKTNNKRFLYNEAVEKLYEIATTIEFAIS